VGGADFRGSNFDWVGCECGDDVDFALMKAEKFSATIENSRAKAPFFEAVFSAGLKSSFPLLKQGAPTERQQPTD
jgi:hypothetical protein